jgi:hypothetical protein
VFTEFLKTALFLVILLAALPTSLVAQTPACPVISGRWKVEQQPYTGTFVFDQSGSSVKGSANWSNHQGGQILGTVKCPNIVSFQINYAGNLVGYYEATLNKNPNKMSGDTHSNMSHDSAQFTATREP